MTRGQANQEAAQAFGQPYQHSEATNPVRPEPPGARYHGRVVQAEGVRLLVPLDTAVFHVTNNAYWTGSAGGTMQAWEFPSGLTVREFFRALGVPNEVREHRQASNGQWVTVQTIRIGDAKAGMKLEEIGWCAGKGTTMPPVWLEDMG
ncbi:MAG: hypothetical protein LQ350_002475 [Teloschistes chrysophthalmus]|nr:MAG: hypothetical protein LQ350_002475 [Niorma chrysophthalma]